MDYKNTTTFGFIRKIKNKRKNNTKICFRLTSYEVAFIKCKKSRTFLVVDISKFDQDLLSRFGLLYTEFV